MEKALIIRMEDNKHIYADAGCAIGSGPYCTVRLRKPAPGICAELHYKNGWYLLDAGSGAGVFVDGTELQPGQKQKIQDGCVVKIAGQSLKVLPLKSADTGTPAYPGAERNPGGSGYYTPCCGIPEPAPVRPKKHMKWYAVLLIILGTIALIQLGLTFFSRNKAERLISEGEYEEAYEAYGIDPIFGTKPQYEMAVELGDKNMGRNEYAAAADWYRRAGDSVRDKLIEAECMNAESLMWYGDYDSAIGRLKEFCDDPAAAEVLSRAESERLEAYCMKNVEKTAEELEKYIDELEYVKDEDVKALRERLYTGAIKELIQNEKAKTALKCAENFADAGSECVDRDILEAYNEGRLVEGAKLALECEKNNGLLDKASWAPLFEADSHSLKRSNEISGGLMQLAASAVYEGRGNKYELTASNMAVKSSMPEDIMEYGEYTYLADIPDIEGFYKMCGTKAAGKVLVLCTYTPYGESEKNAVNYGLNGALPTELIPTSLSEVEYIIRIRYSYGVDGYYDSGTEGVRESATVTVEALPGRNQVFYGGTVYGPNSPQSFYSYFISPKFKSGGTPQIGKEFVSAVDYIMSLK